MSSAGGRNPVTVIVPLYDDLTGIEACIASLLTSIDFSIDRVLLSNDAGPRSDEIEQSILRSVGEHPGFTYHRNPVNLGFVGNCNQAVFDLDTTGNDILLLNSDTIATPGFVDEMAEVLALSDDHAVVAARSNNATIASLPDRRRNPNAPLSMERTIDVHKAVVPFLPRFTVSPVAMGFCFLARRDLIDEFGFFDDVFAPGYGEENDFCLRLNEKGYRSVLANRALVFHTGSTSFSGDRGPALRYAHEKILVERYPSYVGALQVYETHGRDPVDMFADVLHPGDDLLRIAIDLPERPTAHLLGSVAAVIQSLADDAVITVIAPRSHIRAARRAIRSAGVTDGRHSRSVYDVVIGAGEAPSLKRLVRLNRLAPRWILAGYPTAPDRRWSRRVSGYQRDALERISSRFADAFVDVADIGAVKAAVLGLGRETIDVRALRSRWENMSDLGVALGITRVPQKASRWRRTALAFGARSPSMSRRLRKLLRR